MNNNTSMQPGTDNNNESLTWEAPVLYKENWMNTLAKNLHSPEGTSASTAFTPSKQADGQS